MDDNKIKDLIQNFKKRNILGIYCQNKEEKPAMNY